MTPIVVTYASDPHPGLDSLKQSLSFWGWAFAEIKEPWKGLGNRLKRVLHHARLLRNDGFTHVIHVDAFDVLAIGPREEFEGVMESYGNPALLMAVEGGCWPNATLAERYGERKSLWWFPHSQFVLDLRQPEPPKFDDLPDDIDDQVKFHEIALGNHPGVVLDRGCRLFQSIAHSHPWEEWFGVEAQRVRNLKTNSLPLFAHGNGRTDMAWVPRCQILL